MNTTKNHMFAVIWLVTLIGVLIYGYNQVFLTPSNFPTGKSFIINENESLASVSERLKEGGFITSPLLFRMGISFLGQDRNIKLGGYSFDSPMSLLGVVDAFVRNGPNAPLLSVTIPEGSTLVEVTSLIAKTLPSLSQELFMNLVKSNNLDGKLFPSTYFLLPSSTEESIIKMMFTTFTKKVEPIITSSNIPSPLKDTNEVIILASILEGEAKTETDMKIIAGILLQRLIIGMPLQVDVALETYKTRGLPKEPINNPGIIAITSVLNPTPSPYLFYITGNDGNMYYAITFDEHKRNIRKYLK